jgi:hypothetical protein
MEALRRENELLKLNLEIVLEKVRTQDTELRALRAKAENVQATQSWAVTDNQLRLFNEIPPQPHFAVKERMETPKPKPAAPTTNPIHDVEAALKALQAARDPESKRRAAQNLDKAWKRLQKELAK